MATIGLRDLYCAQITEGADGAENYGEPTVLAKAISAEMSVEVAKEMLYADDGVDAVATEFVSGTLTLNINDLSPEKASLLLGQEKDADGVIYGGGDDNAPYFAVGFRAKKADGRYRYVWLYKVKFAVPSESYATKKDGIEFSTPELEGMFTLRNKDNKWKADFEGTPDDAVAKEWFKAVREVSASKTTGGK